MAPTSGSLRDALYISCRRAWEGWKKKHPEENFYAFALYTTMDSEYFIPTVAGESGLTKVARKYLKDKSYATLDDARHALRWSFADSPYHEQGERFNQGVDEALDAEPIPYDQSERAADKVIKARLGAAVAALKDLDAEGLFGKGDRRKKLVLLIEAGDRDEKWSLDFAKKLNLRAVYEAYAKQFEPERIGKFSELGSKKVYQTLRLSLSADNHYLLAASSDKTFYFNLRQRKELWSRPVRRGQDHSLSGCATSGDGTRIAIAWETVTAAKKQCGASLWGGKDWKESLEVNLPSQAGDIVLDPSGKWFAVPLIDSSLIVFDAMTGKRIQTLKDHKDWSRRLAVSPDGKWLASADEKAGVFLWNTANWSRAKRFAVPADHVSIDGRSQLVAATLCYADDDDHPAAKVATVWNIVAGKVAREVRVPGWKIKRAVLSPDGKKIACALEHNTDIMRQKAALIDLSSGQSRCELAADFEDIYDFAFLPDNKTIAVAVHGMHYKPVILWKVSSSNG